MAAGDSFLWIGGLLGDWSDPTNWQDMTTGTSPATAPPGMNDDATIASPVGQITTITGTGSALRLVLGGGGTDLGSGAPSIDDIRGQISVEILSAPARASISNGGTIIADAASVANQKDFAVTGAGSELIASTILEVGQPVSGRSLSVAAGGFIQAGSLDLLQAGISIDATSSFEVGHVGAGVLGALTIDGIANIDGVPPPVVPLPGVDPFEFFQFFPPVIGFPASIDANVIVNAGGRLNATGVVNINGSLTVNSGGLIDGTGQLRLSSVTDNGSITGHILFLDNSTVSGSGIIRVGDNNGGIGIGSGEVVAPGSLTLQVGNFGTLLVMGNIAAGNTISLFGSGNLLQLTNLPHVDAPIVGFDATDTLRVNAPLDQVTYTAGSDGNAGSLLLLNGGIAVEDLRLVGDYPGQTFVLNQVSGSQSDIVVRPTPVPPGPVECFAAGTRIAIRRGSVAVEELHVGDLVMTVSGRLQPIQWMGRRTVKCRRHPAADRVQPVRIAPHAFGENRPRRPLLLSPDHSVFVEGVLIPVRFLINGTTVAQLDVATISYYHMELPRHDVVLAEGLPSETYLETGGRDAFENGGGATQLHPDFAPDEARVAMIWQTFGYAPLLGTDGQFDRVVARLALQADMLGYLTDGTRRRRHAH
jgi:Hint domain